MSLKLKEFVPGGTGCMGKGEVRVDGNESKCKVEGPRNLMSIRGV